MKMCARNVGLGAARARFWAVLLKRSTMSWRSSETLAELLQVFCCDPVMKAPSEASVLVW